jgi:hypothetical protein
MGWLRDYLWLNSSQLINGYNCSLHKTLNNRIKSIIIIRRRESWEDLLAARKNT